MVEYITLNIHDQHIICRMWKGLTTNGNADAYASYLADDLFPRHWIESKGNLRLPFALFLQKTDERLTKGYSPETPG